MGGVTGLDVAARRPDLVDAAIAEDPAFTTPAWNRRLRLGAFRQVREMESIAADPGARFEKETRENPTWSHREVRASVEAGAGVDLGFIAVGCVGPPTPWEEVIDNLAVPTLIVTGTDRVVLRGEYLTNITRRANPRISTAVVVGAPHCVRRTRPERFHAVTDPWLRPHLPFPSPKPADHAHPVDNSGRPAGPRPAALPRTRRFPVERAPPICTFDWKPARSRESGCPGGVRRGGAAGRPPAQAGRRRRADPRPR